MPSEPAQSTPEKRCSTIERLAIKWASACVVTVLAAIIGINAAWLHSTWLPIVATTGGGAVLAAGWQRLLGARVPLASKIFISLSSFVASVAVAFAQDQGAILFAFGALLAALVGVSIWTAPTPRDHSQLLAHEDEALTEEQRDLIRKNLWVVTSASSSLATSITGLTIAVGGTAWIAMSATDSWRLLLPIASAIVVAVVIGDQIGSSWIGQAMWALVAGVTTGAVGASVMTSLGHGKTLGHLVLPSVASLLGPQATVIALGVGTGILVAVAVMVIDALFGDHTTDTGPLAAVSRGAAKFFMCGLVIYIVLRVAGS